MTFVSILDPIHDVGVHQLEEHATVAKLWTAEGGGAIPAETEILIVRTTDVTPTDLDRLPLLRLIVKHGVGVDNLDLPACTQRGVTVCNTPGVGAQAVAEHAVALVVACAKHLVTLDHAQRRGDFEIRYRLRTMELRGKTAGVVGLGNIGQRAAAMLRGFGMSIVGYDAFLPREVEVEGITRVHTLAELTTAADVITLHLPLTEANRNLFDHGTLARMKPGSIIVNTSRGGLIDEIALAQHLSSGHLRAAGIDVFEVEPPPADDPLWDLDNVIVTPHIAGLTEETGAHLALACAETVETYLANRPLTAVLNAEISVK